MWWKSPARKKNKKKIFFNSSFCFTPNIISNQISQENLTQWKDNLTCPVLDPKRQPSLLVWFEPKTINLVLTNYSNWPFLKNNLKKLTKVLSRIYINPFQPLVYIRHWFSFKCPLEVYIRHDAAFQFPILLSASL